MLELTRLRATIISCVDDEAALGAMPVCAAAFKARIAADEVWLIGPARLASVIADHARRHLDQPGSYGVVIDVTDAWSALSVRGSGVVLVWQRFSENALPIERPGFSQGAVAFIGARAIVFDDCIVFFTPAPQGHHLEHRILRGCADLEPRMSEPRELSLEPGGAAGTVAR